MVQKALASILFLCSVQIVFSLSRERYRALPGYQFEFDNIVTIVRSNRIQCVRACKESNLCDVINVRIYGDLLECDLQAKTPNKTSYVTKPGNDEHLMICKFHYFT